MDGPCAIEGCDRPVRSRGWCNRHYQRWYLHGDPEVIYSNKGKPPIVRFTEKYEVQQSGCWLWTGTTTRKGYGMFWPTAKATPAHRWSYEHFVGPIPEGLQLDHLCRVRNCVNPEHLEPVTAKENQIRSPFNPEARTHCPRDHEYTPDNTYVYQGRRSCRACARVSKAASAARRRPR
jgi:hypothetical protein